MGSPSVPKAPPLPPPPPSLLDPALQEARRRALARARGRSGFQRSIVAGSGERAVSASPSLIGTSNLGGTTPLLGV
jgi:hypothetical protein